MGTRAAPAGTSRRPVTAAVVLCAAMLGSVACEYTYDEVRAPLPSATTTSPTDVALPRDPALNTPVTGDAISEWAEDALPDSEGHTFHSGSGLLDAASTRTEETVQLPEGLYSVTLACRSPRRVAFTVRQDQAAQPSAAVPESPNPRDDAATLVDLSLQCSTTRVNVVQLTKASVLSITIRARSAANFAYRVNRI